MDILKDKIDKERLPKHIAVIMDGNGRWAKERGNIRIFGHQHGVDAVRATTETAVKLGIKYLTLYAFSTENWNRSEAEVTALMQLLAKTIKNELKTLNDNNVRLNAVGDLHRLPKYDYDSLMDTMENTKNNDRMTLTLCLSYSGRWDLTQAVQHIANDVKAGILSPNDVNENLINNYLSTAGLPDPELLIRTSGELRISNFLLWELAYTELYFTNKYWPDFGEDDLYEAIINYQSRDRRFGKTK